MRQVSGGFEPRFNVTRTDGNPCRPEARYFVIDYAGDPHARAAVGAYAASIADENPVLASDLREALIHPERFPTQHGSDADLIATLQAREAELVEATPAPLLAVMRRMDLGYGYPAADIADDTGLPVADVRAIMRSLAAFGWAKRHPFFDEDSGAIHGSGYSLTKAGIAARTTLSRTEGQG